MSRDPMPPPNVSTRDLDHAPKRRGMYVQVPEYPRLSGFTGADKYERGRDMQVERGPRVKPIEFDE